MMRAPLALALAVLSLASLLTVPAIAGNEPWVINEVRVTIDDDCFTLSLATPVDPAVHGWERRVGDQVRKTALQMRRDAASINDPCDVARRALAIQAATRLSNAARTVLCVETARPGECLLAVPDLVCGG